MLNNIISCSFTIIMHVKTSILLQYTLIYAYWYIQFIASRVYVDAALSCHCFLVLPDEILFPCSCLSRFVR